MIVDELRTALDPVVFANSLGIVPDPWQAKVLRSNAKRVLLNCSRQSGKTTVCSIVALHRAVHFPKQIILIVSPSLRQSSEVIKRIMGLLECMKLRPKLTEDNKLSIGFANSSRIIALPSLEANVRGFCADLIFEDEASRIPDPVYTALRPTISVSGGRLILASTPRGKRGHFHSEWVGEGDWERWLVDARACPRITARFLMEEQVSLGPLFEQEYFGRFIEMENQLFSNDLVAQAISEDVKPLFGGDK